VLRFRLIVKRGPWSRPQASEGEAQHGPFCLRRWLGAPPRPATAERAPPRGRYAQGVNFTKRLRDAVNGPERKVPNDVRAAFPKRTGPPDPENEGPRGSRHWAGV